MMLVAKAIEKGGYTSDGIQKALFDVAETYVGPSGAKKFDQYGISQGVYEWMIVKDGQWTRLREEIREAVLAGFPPRGLPARKRSTRWHCSPNFWSTA